MNDISILKSAFVSSPVLFYEKTALQTHFQGLYWFRRGLWSWGSHPQTPRLRTNRETKYKRRRTVRVSSLSAAHEPWCTHTSGIWCRLCEKPCRVSFAPVDVSWSYWSNKPVDGRIAKGMLKQRLWWETPQGIGFRTGVRFPSGPFWNILKSQQNQGFQGLAWTFVLITLDYSGNHLATPILLISETISRLYSICEISYV